VKTKNVFIVGCARTGSTLLRQVLNKSEKVCILPETHFLRRLSRGGRRKLLNGIGDLSDDHNVDKLINDILFTDNSRRIGYWGWLRKSVDKQVFRQRLLESDRSERAIFSLLMQSYAELKRGEVYDDLILGEKTPTHLYYVPTLLEWFPHAKIIHTFRDPRGIFVSVLKRVKTGKWNLRAKFPSIPGWLLNSMIDPVGLLHVTKTWLDAASLHSRYKQLYPQNYHLVRFEDLIAEPENQIKQVCDFLNVPFDGRMLEEIRVIGSSYQPQRHGPSGFDKQAIDRWRQHINPLVSAWFSILGRKHLQEFGYHP
jgi:Sulfotransferase family